MKKMLYVLLAVVALTLTACEPVATSVSSTEALINTPTQPPPTPTTDPVVEKITGSYMTTIATGEAASGVDPGDYLFKIQKNLRYFITDLGGFVYAQGYYTITPDQIVLKTTGGPVAGPCVNIPNTYHWVLDGQTLTFSAVDISVECNGEEFFFTIHPFAKRP